MKLNGLSFLMLGLVLLMGATSCSKDDDNDDGPGDDMEVITMSADIDGSSWVADTIAASNPGLAVNFQGKPYVGFLPSMIVTIRPGQVVGVHPFAVVGEVETARYVDAQGNVFIASSGSVEILKHRVDEYIEGTFSFTGVHTLNTLPDVTVTNGKFSSFY